MIPVSEREHGGVVALAAPPELLEPLPAADLRAPAVEAALLALLHQPARLLAWQFAGMLSRR